MWLGQKIQKMLRPLMSGSKTSGLIVSQDAN
ncbi:hypothetical protein EM595_1996 [Duffyella gerundensis]|uniref:Uncharacterized protein n=1 Tax=Duffyella gerundensis TaxID=1619313 RepID=A0A0U5L644_9GAMM|nr:hypothetical protein EM595_1996 [Duffyella gerundensis]